MSPVPWKQWEGQVVDLCFPLRRYLGGSARSAVYLTQYGDPEPRNAAIKLVPAGTPESEPSAQWERAARLNHPNLLRLLYTGRWQVNQLAVRYAVSEYADENLAEVLAQRPLTVAEVRDMLKPLLGALAYLHREGLVHGHLKPANILAVGDELKLSVDGITLVGEPGALSAPSAYDPPEFQERGCSPVGDVWSIGMTLVEALTQRLPAAGPPQQEPVLPDTLPAEFVPMVRACLQPDPRRRASVDRILALLDRGEAVAAPERVRERNGASSRKFAPLALVGVAAVLAAAILAGPRLLHRPAEPLAPGKAVAAPAPSPAALEASKDADPVPVAVDKPATKPPAVSPPATVPRSAPAAPPRGSVAEAPSGEVVHQVMPDVPDYARRTIRGVVKIQVRATADSAGRVTEATVVSQNSRYFAKLADSAARKWDFSGPGEWILRFEFTPERSSVHPSRVR